MPVSARSDSRRSTPSPGVGRRNLQLLSNDVAIAHGLDNGSPIRAPLNRVVGS
jgi:hypothetical protein